MTPIDQIRAEIERKQSENLKHFKDGLISVGTLAARDGQLLHIRTFIDSLPEQPASGDLEEEVKKWVYDVVYDLDGPALMGTSEYLSVEDVANIARHFAEWGAEHLKK